MAKVIPFKGLRYNTEKIADMEAVTSPPYDIISSEQQQELYNQNEYNVIRIDYGMEFASDDEENNKYARSAAYLKKWIDDGILKYDDKNAFYIYEQIFSLESNAKPSNSLKGIISLVELKEFSEGVILPHEETLPKAKTDRLNLIRSTHANTSPIYSLYSDEEQELADLINDMSDRDPDISFTTQEDVIQNLWVVTDEEFLNKVTEFFSRKQLFIADGHHRYETALNYRAERRAEDGSEPGSMPYDYTMMMLVSMDDSGLFVFPTHRMIKGIDNFSELMVVGMMTDQFLVSKVHFTEGDYAEIITDKLSGNVDDHLFAFYTGEEYYYLLKLKDISIMDDYVKDRSDTYKSLDVTILHKLILEQYFGIDSEKLKEQSKVVYTRSAHELVEKVQSGEMQCGFLLGATKVSQIKNISIENEKMPQKSTYFWPKLVTGLVLNKFE
ncbi:MAG TPA: DUF1015 domain-containing protein [Firmicutes bacterium]|nr:DUF1015 domain-containing protein [Bacillota bacterium]